MDAQTAEPIVPKFDIGIQEHLEIKIVYVLLFIYDYQVILFEKKSFQIENRIFKKLAIRRKICFPNNINNEMS